MPVWLWISRDCSIAFDSQQALGTHQLKFCTNSKYANLDTLNTEYLNLQGRQDQNQNQQQGKKSQPALSGSQYSQMELSFRQ